MNYRLHYAPDNASLIIRLTLEELGQPYETILVNRSTGGHKSPAYMDLNPNGLIPVLETPDGPLFETGAILLWLADRHKRMAPAPDDPQRGAFLKWLFFVSNTLHPSIRMTFYPDKYIGNDKSIQSRLRSHMQGEIACHLDKLETVATQTPWLGGSDISVLDFYLAALLRWLALYPLPMGGTGWFSIRQWPHMHSITTRLERCRSVQVAIKAEGLGPKPFTDPQLATPPEGSAI